MTAQPLPLFTGPHAVRPDGLGGLLDAEGRAFPLAEVRVRATVLGAFARTVVEQRFENHRDRPVEVVHTFPLPPGAAVVEMELRAGETVVRAVCKARDEAAATFAAARSAGHRAALLDAERPDVHTLRATNIPARATVTVRLVLVELLPAIDGRFQWRFPTTLAPRFMPGNAVGHSGPGVEADTDRVPDASRISPPLRLAGGTRLDLEVELVGPISGLASSLHAVSVALAPDGAAGGRVRVAPSAQATLNQDFILIFTTADPAHLCTRAYTDGSFSLLVLEPPSVALAPTLPRDAVFVVDISGSMDGSKMAAAKRALHTALHGLSMGDRFRLIAFDDRVEWHSREFLAYDDASLASADAWISRLDARGGTVMVPALTAALEEHTPENRLRTVLFITDGQAGDEDQVLAAVAGRRGAARVFTLGIDTAVNASLLERVARVGGGTCELCTPSDDIEGVVARLEARFGSPVLSGVRVEAGSAGVVLTAGNPEAAALFSGRPLSLSFEGSAPTLRIQGIGRAGAWQETVTPLKVEAPLGAMWARERVRWLEDRLALRPFEEEAIRGEVLRVALAHGIVSKFTSLVAVDQSVKVDGQLVEVVQPVELPAAWEGAATGGGGASARSRGGPPGSPKMKRAMAPPSPVSFSGPPSPAPMAPSPARAAAMPPPPPPGVTPIVAVPAPAMESLSAPDLDDRVASADVADRYAAEDRSVQQPLSAPRSAPKGGLLGSLAAGVARLFKSAPAEAPEEDEEVMAMREESPRRASAASARDRAEKEQKPEAKKRAPQADPGGTLARTQSADGSFGGDVLRTAAALLVLLRLGNTRRVGTRQRNVAKAAAWLQAFVADPTHGALVTQVLDTLAAAEAGTPAGADPRWASLFGAGAEGALLEEVS